MNGPRLPNPYGNICTVALDLPWEVAELLASHGPQLIAAIARAVELRQAEARHNTAVAALLDKEAEKNKAEWAALAKHCEAEIARRSNRPSDRNVVIKQLAVELKVTAQFIKTICKVFRSQEHDRRHAEMLRLYAAGWTNVQIAQKFRISAETVSRALSKEKDLLKGVRALAAETNKLNTSTEEPTL